MTARDQARQWLAERLAAAYDLCSHDRGGYSPCDTCRADAILDAPGVTVVQPAGVGRIRILLPLDTSQTVAAPPESNAGGPAGTGESDGKDDRVDGGAQAVSAVDVARRLAAFANDPDWLVGWLNTHGLSSDAGPAAVINALAHDWHSWAITHPDGRDG